MSGPQLTPPPVADVSKDCRKGGAILTILHSKQYVGQDLKMLTLGTIGGKEGEGIWQRQVLEQYIVLCKHLLSKASVVNQSSMRDSLNVGNTTTARRISRRISRETSNMCLPALDNLGVYVPDPGEDKREPVGSRGRLHRLTPDSSNSWVCRRGKEELGSRLPACHNPQLTYRVIIPKSALDADVEPWSEFKKGTALRSGASEGMRFCFSPEKQPTRIDVGLVEKAWSGTFRDRRAGQQLHIVNAEGDVGPQRLQPNCCPKGMLHGNSVAWEFSMTHCNPMGIVELAMEILLKAMHNDKARVCMDFSPQKA
ncbi:MAG: hypothetical protein FRX49_11757 [Trebouxia sp. A1-2]|nr:MAG: hypothetical protein FRX49_11757 [Trebouxia sp. A1-2]